METLLRIIARQKGNMLQIKLLAGKAALINNKIEIELPRRFSANELADWCEHQRGRLGKQFPPVVILVGN